MTDYGKLVEMLEAIVSNGELGSAWFAKQALPLARQLIAENKQLQEDAEFAAEFMQTFESLREENERLKTEQPLKLATEQVVYLQTRLSAAEERASGMNREWQDEYARRLVADRRLKRAEAVVEAAKDHQTHPDAKLMRTIRQYERAKKDVTPGPISDR